MWQCVRISILLLLCCAGAPFFAHTLDMNPEVNDDIRFNDLPRFESNEQKLMRGLLTDYDNSVRPVYNALEAVDVKLGLTLTQILDIDEKNQVLTTNVWLEAEWFDERLNWSAPDYGGVYAIRIPSEKLWLPDIVLYNSVDDYTSGYMPTLAMVYNTSRVFWGPVIRFRSSCKIDITFFPFDTQVCKLKLGSWAYTGLEVNVWNSSNAMDLSNFVDNGEWELLGVAVERNVVFYNCCEEPFPDVTFTMQLRRRTKYYFMNIIIPCIILSFLCLGGFLLPPDSGEKITLGLSVLLTITVFMLMVADKMPQTSESISVISIYLMVVLTTSCLSVLSSVLVLSIHHQRGRPSPAPTWLKRLCFNIIAPMLCLRRQSDVRSAHDIIKTASGRGSRVRRDGGFRKGSKIASSRDDHECVRMDYDNEIDRSDVKFNFEKEKGNVTSEQVYTPSQQHSKTIKASYTPMQRQPNYRLNQRQCKDTQNPDQDKYTHNQGQGNYTHNQGQGRYTHNQDQGKYSPQQHRHALDDTDSSFSELADAEDVNVGIEKQHHDDHVDDASTRGPKTSKANNLVARYLINLIQTRQEVEMNDEEIFHEWHDVAYVLDRLLFYLFFVITLVSTVCILEMRPPLETI